MERVKEEQSHVAEALDSTSSDTSCGVPTRTFSSLCFGSV